MRNFQGIIFQVVHLSKNEYYSQFDFSVEMNIITNTRVEITNFSVEMNIITNTRVEITNTRVEMNIITNTRVFLKRILCSILTFL